MTFKLRDMRSQGRAAAATRWSSRAWLAGCIIGAAQFALPAVAMAGLAMPNDGSTAKLSDASATAETNKVFNTLRTRTLQSYSNMIEGQHMGGPGDLDSSGVFDMNTYRIDSATPGRHAYPRMVGARYDAYDVNGHYTLDSGSIRAINDHLIETSAIYHPIISITATPRNPWNLSAGRTYDPADGSLADLDISKRDVVNSPAWKFWRDVDTIAEGLAYLKAADGTPIPVLFRPFAEINTSEKYYFRGQKSPEFVKLWKEVADYYVTTKGLHNLIFCWEAWVWNRDPSKTPSEVDIAPWYPVASTELPNPYVDVVSGAFYFMSKHLPYFTLDLPDGSADKQVFYTLMNLAVSNNKPFGAAQWAVNYKYDSGTNACAYGDDANTLTFMSSVDAKHYSKVSPPPDGPVQHMAFAYYWGDNKGCMDVQNQANATQFVDDARVASVTGVDHLNSEGGWIRETAQGTGKGGTLRAGLPLRTGDSSATGGCTNCQYRSIVSFNTSSTLPGNAVVAAPTATLLLTKSSTSTTTSPYATGLGPLWIDVASPYFGASLAFNSDDFKTDTVRDLVHVATMTDPAASKSGTLSYGALPVQYVARQGHTQLRLMFQTATDGKNSDNYIDWNGATGTTPELILTYTLPNP